MAVDDDLITAEDVAELLGVPTSGVYALVAREAIRYVRIGRWWKGASYRFRQSEIEEWLRSDPYFRAASDENTEDLGEDG